MGKKANSGRNKVTVGSVVGKKPPTGEEQAESAATADHTSGKLAPLSLKGDGTIMGDVRGKRPTFMEAYTTDSEGESTYPTPDNPSGALERGKPPSGPIRYKVVGNHPRVAVSGMVVAFKDGKELADNVFDIRNIRSQGVKLKEIKPEGAEEEAETGEEEGEAEGD